MEFEEGKYYRHNTGEMMHIIARNELSDIFANPSLIAERESSHLVSVGIGEEYAVNWVEVSESEWKARLSSTDEP